MNYLKKATIIGAGWLGMPLASTLLQQEYQVIATKQSPKNLAETTQRLSRFTKNLNKIDVIAFSPSRLNQQEIKSEELSHLFTDRQIIITIPPTPFLPSSKNSQSPDNTAYAQFITQIADLAENYHAQEIIYTSSTSIYGASSGIIHEALPALPQTMNAKAIYQAEKALQNRKIPITILRLAGLIGHGRHPIFSLQGRDNIRSPFNAINLLHIQDLIQAITVILQRKKSPDAYDLYNLVTPTHPNRISYYQTLATHLNLALPLFEAPKPELKRIIDGGKITEIGDFNYQITDLVHASLEKMI